MTSKIREKEEKPGNSRKQNLYGTLMKLYDIFNEITWNFNEIIRNSDEIIWNFNEIIWNFNEIKSVSNPGDRENRVDTVSLPANPGDMTCCIY